MEHIVYVVDDDDAVRQSVTGLLESADLNAIGFSSAEAFLQHRFEDLPSCVILDMQMPTITGFDVADALKDSGREIPIIFLTGHGTIPMSVRAIKGGINEISRRINVRREWVYMVLVGRGKSARVLRAAEQLIAERKQTN